MKRIVVLVLAAAAVAGCASAAPPPVTPARDPAGVPGRLRAPRRLAGGAQGAGDDLARGLAVHSGPLDVTITVTGPHGNA